MLSELWEREKGIKRHWSGKQRKVGACALRAHSAELLRWDQGGRSPGLKITLHTQHRPGWGIAQGLSWRPQSPLLLAQWTYQRTSMEETWEQAARPAATGRPGRRAAADARTHGPYHSQEAPVSPHWSPLSLPQPEFGTTAASLRITGSSVARMRPRCPSQSALRGSFYSLLLFEPKSSRGTSDWWPPSHMSTSSSKVC